MALFQWDESFSVNVRQSDEEHKRLIALVNELHDAMRKGRSKEVMGQIFDGLVSYTVTHFSAEEKLLRDNQYPRFAEHSKKHDDLCATALKLQKEFQSGKTSVSLDTLEFLRSWLVNHIKGDDKAYSAHLNSKGVR